MEERTADEVAKIFYNAGYSVKVINADANYSAFIERTEASRETEDSWKAMIKRNVDHLEIIKAYKKADKTTSIWTTEDFTDIDKAITDGKKVYE